MHVVFSLIVHYCNCNYVWNKPDDDDDDDDDLSLTSKCFCCKGMDVETRREAYDSGGYLTLHLAYSNVFLNPFIYMLQYDVVKRSLINSARNVAAKLRNQQPSSI